MKAAVICDHKLAKKGNKFYINSGPYERSVKRYLNVFDHVNYVSRSINVDDIEGKVYINDENVSIFPNYHSIIDLSLIRNYHKIVKNIKLVIESSDACIIHLPSLMGIFAVSECKKQNKPYLIEVVGSVWDVYWNHSIKGKFIAPLLTILTKSAVKNAEYVLYVTEKYLQKKLPTHGRTTACSDVSLPYVSDDVLKERLERINILNKDRNVVIGTTAVLDVRYKGQEYIIRALSKLKEEGYNYEYHLMGGGDNCYLESVAKKYNVHDRVTFLGYIPHEKIFEYLDNIDLYVQPSKTEGLPRALVEAMSRGCPCIGSGVGGISELINPDFTFAYADVDMICNLLRNIDKETMGKEAIRNFNKAKEFNKSILDKKRNNFFKVFADEVKSHD